MSRFKPNLHPRDSKGRFRNKSGGSTRRSRAANRVAGVGRVLQAEAGGAVLGYAVGGKYGAIAGATLAGRSALNDNAKRIRTGIR